MEKCLKCNGIDKDDYVSCERCDIRICCDCVYYPMNDSNTNTDPWSGYFCIDCIPIVDSRSTVFYKLGITT